MDDKTEELRDIFMDVSEDATVTEAQEESPGSLATDESAVESAVADVVSRMREEYEFTTDLDDEALVTVVRRFYAGDDDAAIADALADAGDDVDAGEDAAAADAAAVDVDGETVLTARLDLHLLREDDAPVDEDALRAHADADVEAAATALDSTPDAIRRGRRVLAAREAARRASYRYTSEFEELLADAGLATSMTESATEDGLDEATEDIGSLESDADVSF